MKTDSFEKIQAQRRASNKWGMMSNKNTNPQDKIYEKKKS